ncbi:MAG TPA: hypothetical protein VJT13_27000 [Xanthobacteraceae bacterium]|nr:hypothetical protein [Xanthobacteraceae bacterium]
MLHRKVGGAMTTAESSNFDRPAGPFARGGVFLMSDANNKPGASPARTWTVTLGISFAVLFAMYGLAFINDAHIRVSAPSLIGTASGAPSR